MIRPTHTGCCERKKHETIHSIKAIYLQNFVFFSAHNTPFCIFFADELYYQVVFCFAFERIESACFIIILSRPNPVIILERGKVFLIIIRIVIKYTQF